MKLILKSLIGHVVTTDSAQVNPSSHTYTGPVTLAQLAALWRLGDDLFMPSVKNAAVDDMCRRIYLEREDPTNDLVEICQVAKASKALRPLLVDYYTDTRNGDKKWAKFCHGGRRDTRLPRILQDEICQLRADNYAAQGYNATYTRKLYHDGIGCTYHDRYFDEAGIPFNWHQVQGKIQNKVFKLQKVARDRLAIEDQRASDNDDDDDSATSEDSDSSDSDSTIQGDGEESALETEDQLADYDLETDEQEEEGEEDEGEQEGQDIEYDDEEGPTTIYIESEEFDASEAPNAFEEPDAVDEEPNVIEESNAIEEHFDENEGVDLESEYLGPTWEEEERDRHINAQWMMDAVQDYSSGYDARVTQWNTQNLGRESGASEEDDSEEESSEDEDDIANWGNRLKRKRARQAHRERERHRVTSIDDMEEVPRWVNNTEVPADPASPNITVLTTPMRTPSSSPPPPPPALSPTPPRSPPPNRFLPPYVFEQIRF